MYRSSDAVNDSLTKSYIIIVPNSENIFYEKQTNRGSPSKCLKIKKSKNWQKKYSHLTYKREEFSWARSMMSVNI